jgi:monoterpene epsilon-lactone hydrolase
MTSLQANLLKTYLRLFSPPHPTLDVPRERRDLESLAKLFKPLGAIQAEAIDAGGIPAEWITPQDYAEQRTLLYLHGGSYNAGSINTHRSIAANFAIFSRARALIIDYRLAPEHPFPAALEDAAAAYTWLLGQGHAPQHIALVGDSAGGGLVLCLLLHLRDEALPLPAAAVCLSPWTDLAGTGKSARTNARSDIVINAENGLRCAEVYLAGADPCNPLASPLYADLRGLPPLLLQVGSDEILLSDSTELARLAKAAGVEVTLDIWTGMQHVWQYAASIIPEGRRAIQQAATFIVHWIPD